LKETSELKNFRSATETNGREKKREREEIRSIAPGQRPDGLKNTRYLNKLSGV
jgi:hypothetical protein